MSCSPTAAKGWFPPVLIAILAICATPIQAQPTPDFTVKMTVLRLSDSGDDNDSLSDSDFYVAGSFTPRNGTAIPFENEAARQEGEETIHPNWEFEFDVPSTSGGGELHFRALDYDSGLNFGDDTTIDARLDVDFGSCAITGNGISTTCGWDIAINQGDSATLRLEVFWPPSSPGLLVRCLQDPLLPRPGDAVTIDMEVLDGAGGPKVASDLQILVNNTIMQRVTAQSQTAYAFTANGPHFVLQCRARNTVGANPDAEMADTRSRLVRVGFPAERWSPVGVAASAARAIDVVVLVDRDFAPPAGLTGLSLPEEPAVLAEIRQALWTSFMNNPYVLANQHRFNFWLGRSTADFQGTATTCILVQPPEDWDQYAFADVGWIAHRDAAMQRDCAAPSLRAFGGATNDAAAAVHETGHVPFGLADEYCCDGGYFQAPMLPNVYNGIQACTNDLPTDGTAAVCRNITGMVFTSDPLPDLMTDDRMTFNRLDRRRADWLLDRCANAAEGC